MAFGRDAEHSATGQGQGPAAPQRGGRGLVPVPPGARAGADAEAASGCSRRRKGEKLKLPVSLVPKAEMMVWDGIPAPSR